MSVFEDDTPKILRFFKSDDTEFTSSVLPGTFECEDVLVSDQLNFGQAASARVQFETDEDLELAGLLIYVTYGTSTEFTKIGTYKVTYTSTKVNSSVCTITAYDVVKDADVNVASWYNSVSFPTTVSQLRQSLCNHLGITQISRTLINDGAYLQKTVNPTEISGRDILGYIGQINACFPHATADGELDWISLGTAAKSVSPSLFIGAKAYEAKSYQTAAIGGVTIRSEEGDVGVSVGSGTNQFIIEANILLYGLDPVDLRPIATNIYNKIKNCRYVPSTLLMKYVPGYGLGELLSYDGKLFYNLGHKLSGCLHAEIIADGNQYLEDTGLETSVQQLMGKSNVLERTLEGVTQTVQEFDATYVKESTFSQTVDGITSQISSIEQEIDGSIQVYNTTEEPTLLNYPAWDFTFTIPCNDTVLCSEDLTLEYKPEYYQKFQRSIVYNETSLQTYKFAKDSDTGAYYWRPETDSEFGVALEKISELTQTVDGISANVSSVTQTVTSQGTQISTNSSNITANANSIASEVSRATGAEQTLTSQIKQTAESLSLSVSDQKGSASITISITDSTTGDVKTITKTIDLDADTINLSAADVINMIAGGTINLTSKNIAITSDNFTVDKNGNVLMRSATITGYLKPSNLTDGTTQISGDNITTGTIDADNVDVVNVVAKSVACENLTGETITGKKFNGGEIYISNGYYGLQVGSNGQTTIQRLFTLDGIDIRSSDANTGSYVDFSSKAQAQSGQDFGCRIIQTDVQKLSFFSQFAPGFPVGMCQVEFGNTSVDGVLNVSGNANVQGNISSNGIIYANGKDLDVTDGTTVFASPQDGVLWFMRRDTGNVYQLIGSTPSDTRLKKNIEDSEVNALDIIEQVRAIQFDWKANDEHVPLGFSANQLEEVIPEAVVEVKQKPGNEFETIKQIDTSKLSIYYMKAIQELNAKIEQLESKIKKMEER